jgi:hypothetical protein
MLAFPIAGAKKVAKIVQCGEPFYFCAPGYEPRIPLGGSPMLPQGLKSISRFLPLVALIWLSSSSIQAQTIPSLNELKTRQDELKEPEQNIPDNQIVLSDELHRVDEEIAQYRSAQSIYELANMDLTQIMTLATKLFKDVDALDCKNLGGVNPQSLWANLYQIQQLVQRLPPSADPDPWASIIIGDSDNPSAEVVCKGLKSSVGDEKNRQGLLAYIDTRQKELETYNTQLAAVLAALQKRRGALLPSLSAKTTQTSIGSDLWKIILLIGRAPAL